MSETWQSVPLGQMLSRSETWINLENDKIYQEVTIRLWGKGVIERRKVQGLEIGSLRRLSVRPQQFILSRIDARNGALGLVPPELDGAVVSNDFPVFDVDTSCILPEYLDWLSKTRSFVEICKSASEGTTNRVRSKEDRFLAMRISLPPLAEQRRIVARIEELAAKIEEARRLQSAVVAECDDLCRAFIFQCRPEDIELVPLKDLVRLRPTDINVQPSVVYPFAGVYCFGRGIFRGSKRLGSEFAYTKLTRLRANDFTYPKLMAWEGAFGIVPSECGGLVVSPEYPVFEVIKNRILPETLDIYFKTPSVWAKVAGSSPGTNVRRRRLNPSDFLNHKMPLPSMRVQQTMLDVYQRTSSAKAVHAKASMELNALLPSVLDRAFHGSL